MQEGNLEINPGFCLGLFFLGVIAGYSTNICCDGIILILM